jgi:hypothetical protein
MKRNMGKRRDREGTLVDGLKHTNFMHLLCRSVHFLKLNGLFTKEEAMTKVSFSLHILLNDFLYTCMYMSVQDRRGMKVERRNARDGERGERADIGGRLIS